MNMERITLGAGCFWCVEAVFQRLKGVDRVRSGYMGGHKDHPTYKEVCTGETGHTEVLDVYFDPSVVSLEEVLEVFWTTHDPTTLNRQGNDVGTQYRSAVYYHTEAQKTTAETSKDRVGQPLWDDPIVTEITAASAFYPAEDYHNDYFNQNGAAPFCRIVINPKVAKFKSKFADKIKEEYV